MVAFVTVKTCGDEVNSGRNPVKVKKLPSIGLPSFGPMKSVVMSGSLDVTMMSSRKYIACLKTFTSDIVDLSLSL